MCKIDFKIISFFSVESELSFYSEDSEINFARARSTTVNSRLNRPLKAICKRRRGRILCGRVACILGMESKIRSGGAGKRKAGKQTRGLLWVSWITYNTYIALIRMRSKRFTSIVLQYD